MNWTVIIGPIKNALALADIITDLLDDYDYEYAESPNRTGLNPSYSLLIGRFENQVDAESLAIKIQEEWGFKASASIFPEQYQGEMEVSFNPRAFVNDIFEQSSSGVPAPNICVLVNEKIDEHPHDANEICRLFFTKFKDLDSILAIPYGINYLQNVDDLPFMRVLLTRMQRNEMGNDAIDLLLHRHSINPGDEYRKLVIPLLLTHRPHLILQGDVLDSDEVGNCLREILRYPELSDSELYEDLFIGLRGHNEYRSLRINIAKRYGKMWTPDSGIECELALIEFQSGDIKGPIAKLEEYGNSKHWEKHLEKIQSHRNLLDDGWVFPPRAPNNPHAIPGLVRYLAYTSVPHHTSGYATRTHNILRALHELECNVECLTRYSYPWVDLKLESNAVERLDVIDGVTYHRQQNDANFLSWTLEKRLQVAIESLVEHCEKEGVPEILHVASNWMNGLTAIHAGRILGIPVVYEVRGLWELTRVAKDPNFEDSEHFQMIARMELEVAMAADCVIAITDGLRNELIHRGVSPEKIQLAVNGVDTERFLPLKRDDALADKIGLPSGPVVGYIGSLVEYEGLHLLLEAVSKLRRLGHWTGSVVIVGDGESRGKLESLTEEYGISDICFFTGKVDFREVNRYYSLIDVTPFPRLPEKVCELVSPLKPFEAMAMGKTVLASNVEAMGEFIETGKNGFLFEKGSSDSLSEVLKIVMENEVLRGELAVSARKWVDENRTWIDTAEAISEVHNRVRLLGGSVRPTILIAGHDLKFIYEMGREFIRQGYNVLEDKWVNHTGHDEELSKRLLRVADYVICEWALGNAKWYSEHIQSHQKLFFRLHLQEVDTDHIESVDWSKVDKVVFIAPHVQRKAIHRFAIPKSRTILIPNFVDTRRFDVKKVPTFDDTIGFMGLVPQRKRFDRALTVLEGVRASHSNVNLNVKGKRPEEYEWMLKRTDEMNWYNDQYQRIEESKLLNGAIRYQGWTSSPYSWFEEIGFLLSVSDFEGSHQAVAEGAASGAIPIIVKWEGADEVYPPTWCVNTIEEAIEKILNFKDNLTFEEREMERIKVANHIRENFDLRIIARRWLAMMGLN